MTTGAQIIQSRQFFPEKTDFLPARQGAPQAYCHWVKRFIYFHNVSHPEEMGEPKSNAFGTNFHASPVT